MIPKKGKWRDAGRESTRTIGNLKPARFGPTPIIVDACSQLHLWLSNKSIHRGTKESEMRSRAWACAVTVAALLCLAAACAAAQEGADWPPIPPEDLELKDNPASPGSSAMVLLKREVRNDIKKYWETYYRIKIFTEKGLAYGNIEIPFVPKSVEVDQIAARVIQPDGRILPFTGPIYEKTLARRRRTRVMAKTFTLPEVQPGVILEYRFRARFKMGGTSSGPWVVQEELFVREAQLELHTDADSLRALPRSLPEGAEMQVDGKGVRRATLRNLPPFESEPFMPPENSLKMRFQMVYPRVFYGVHPLSLWRESFNNYIGKTKDYEPFVREVVAAGDSDEVKLRKLYTAVQERIRNLSYEETYTKKERKREGMKERRAAKDVWRLGYGESVEIVMLFAGLCRAAGFTADPVMVAQRDDKLYDSDIPLIDQLDWYLVAVDTPSGPTYFDPGVRFAPNGWVTWPSQGVYGVRMTPERVLDLQIPLLPPERNTRHRQAAVTLQADGSALVDLVTSYSGEHAVERRNDFFDLTKEERERNLRKELEDSFPDARIRHVAWDGMDDASEKAVVTVQFELPALGQILGSRLIVPTTLFAGSSAFPAWKRVHPVYLARSVNLTTDVRLVAPPGYQLEHLPGPSYQMASFGEYGVVVEQDAAAVLSRGRVTTRAVVVQPANYVVVKRFYDAAAASNQSHLVFRKPASE